MNDSQVSTVSWIMAVADYLAGMLRFWVLALLPRILFATCLMDISDESMETSVMSGRLLGA